VAQLDSVEHHLAEAEAGRFAVERLMFHLAGIPTYLLAAELACGRVLYGRLPRPDGYPEALRRDAPPRWWGDARLTLSYARTAYAERGRLAECLGSIAVATCQAGHAVLAGRGEWVTNEKRLVDEAGLRHIDALVTGASGGSSRLTALVDQVQIALQGAVSRQG
jgi:hypothetical protein